MTTDFSSWSIGATSGSLTKGSGAGGEAGEAVVLFSEFPAKRASLFRRICKIFTKDFLTDVWNSMFYLGLTSSWFGSDMIFRFCSLLGNNFLVSWFRYAFVYVWKTKFLLDFSHIKQSDSGKSEIRSESKSVSVVVKHEMSHFDNFS